MARATNDLNAVSLTAGFGIMTLIDSTIYMGFIIFAMGFMISWKLTFCNAASTNHGNPYSIFREDCA